MSSWTPDFDRSGMLFMFVRRDDDRYMIYKFDTPLLVENSESRSFDILPLVVFEDGVLPHCECSFVFIYPYFYIVGAKKEDVFTIDLNVLIALKPSETERGAEFVTRMQPMIADKNPSLAFSFRHKLYVISVYTCPVSLKTENRHEFEVYSSSTNTWRDLGNTPLSRDLLPVYVDSHLVIGTMVYFTTSLDVVMSFDLNGETWTTVFDPYGVLAPTFRYVPPLPTFKSQTLIIGSLIFGLSKRRRNGYYDICASNTFNPGSDFFLRPVLVPDQQVLKVVVDAPMDLPSWSQFIFALGENVLCVVSYGGDMMQDEHGLFCYAELSFFSCLPVYPETGYSGDMCCSNAKFCGRTRFFIRTENQLTHGVPCSCIFVDQ
ncbi:hypothetical protein ACET3Z_010629 [Daucus carota]